MSPHDRHVVFFLLFCLAASHAARSTQHTRKNKGLCVFVALFCFVFLHLRQRLLKSAAPCASGRRLKSPAQLKPRPATKPADMSTRTRVLGVEAPPALCRFFMRLFCAARKTTTPFFLHAHNRQGSGSVSCTIESAVCKTWHEKKAPPGRKGSGKTPCGRRGRRPRGRRVGHPPRKGGPGLFGKLPRGTLGNPWRASSSMQKRERHTTHTRQRTKKTLGNTRKRERALSGRRSRFLLRGFNQRVF